MLSAERHLVTNSAPMAVGVTLQSSPSLQAQKRRRTTAFGSEAEASPEKALKRTKTLKTYSAKGAHIANDRDFENLRTDTGPKTSQSARFTEHSGFHSSAELPAGSIGEDFVNHEPTVLFRDTGSTIPDDSSAQERMLRQALSSKKGLSTSAINGLQEEEAKSSSFPWSASGQTRAGKSPQNAVAAAVDGANDGDEVDASNAGVSGANANVANAYTHLFPEAETVLDDGDGIVVHSAKKPNASPTVEISRTESTTKSSRKDSAGTQRSTKNGKRKAEEAISSEPLNSDDKAIGLPKERYQPRPSRRRATGVVEEPIDFSVRPEKAAKTKRTKTMATSAGSQNTEPALSKDVVATMKADVEKASKASTLSQGKPAPKEESSIDVSKETCPVAECKDLAEGDTNTHEPSSQQPEQPPASSKPRSDDHIFVKPSLPTLGPKSATKSRRARTTIFEDNIEFTGSQRSPTLSQQQAERRKLVAENNVQTGAAESTQRKRKSVVVDDDDVDELAKDPEDDDGDEDEDEDVAPKKRGRGRPSKSKSKPKANANSAEKAMDDSEDDEESPQEETVQSKKRGRGRPSKAEPVAPSNELEKPKATKATAPTDSEQKSTNVTDSAAELEAQSEDAIAIKTKAQVPAKENVTPSPSRQPQTEKTTKTPQKDSKPSPTLHSPIKSSSGVPLRVGLSRHQRIPPLLRTMKAPKV